MASDILWIDQAANRGRPDRVIRRAARTRTGRRATPLLPADGPWQACARRGRRAPTGVSSYNSSETTHGDGMNFAWRIYPRRARAFPHEFKLAYRTEVTQLGHDVVEEIAKRHGATR